MRERFHQGLDDLRAKLLAMGGLAEQAVERATQAYRDRDLRLCSAVLEGERSINRTEREIDELALDLLAMQQPMAVDLRFITAVMKRRSTAMGCCMANKSSASSSISRSVRLMERSPSSTALHRRK